MAGKNIVGGKVEERLFYHAKNTVITGLRLTAKLPEFVSLVDFLFVVFALAAVLTILELS